MPSRTRRTRSRTSKLRLHANQERAVLRGGPFLLNGPHCPGAKRRGIIGEHELDCFAGSAMTRFWIAAALLVIAACRDERPPAPTPEQSDQLNQAEDMLNDL